MKIHNVEQRSQEWLDLRLGVPTASEFSKALTPKTGVLSAQHSVFACKLALELFHGETDDDFFTSEWMERGIGLEDEAIAQYEMLQDVDVTRVGFILDEKGRGYSPDGLVGDGGCVEVKCIKPSSQLAAIIEYEDTGDFDAKYTPQIQGGMLIAERRWCDLILYAPGHPLGVIRIEPDEKYQANLDKALDTIIQKRDRALSKLRGDNIERIAA